jgi:hypothetical protein
MGVSLTPEPMRGSPTKPFAQALRRSATPLDNSRTMGPALGTHYTKPSVAAMSPSLLLQQHQQRLGTPAVRVGAPSGQAAASVQRQHAPPNGIAQHARRAAAGGIDAVTRFVNSELRTLGDDMHHASVQRLGVYRSGFSRLAATLSDDVKVYVERIFAEYDALLAQSQHALSNSSLDKDRKRLEEHYAAAADRRQRDHQRVMDKQLAAVARSEAAVAERLKGLKEQTKLLEAENGAMRAQQRDDHERGIMMAQSVVEARFAFQVAEARRLDVERQLERLERVEKNKLDLLADAVEMQNMLMKNKLTYKMRTAFIFDDAIADDDDELVPGVSKPITRGVVSQRQ